MLMLLLRRVVQVDNDPTEILTDKCQTEDGENNKQQQEVTVKANAISVSIIYL